MRILYVINTGLLGGLQRHVLCLMESLGKDVETAVVFNTEIEPCVVDMFLDKGVQVYRLHGRSGHDCRIVWRFRKVLNTFNPDIIHAHGMPLCCLMYLCLFYRCVPIVNSLHSPPRRPTFTNWFQWKLLEWRVAYWLPVSTSTWDCFKKWHPKVNGEVFFNPIKIEDQRIPKLRDSHGRAFVVGMVGRNADQKDWPSFHKVEQLVREKKPKVTFLNAGEESICDGREAIASMDLFVMTSKHEQLPTTVLECFSLGTPICGFLPEGGTRDILSYSLGPVKNAFIKTRSCSELADMVLCLIDNPVKRQALIEDGWQILVNQFDAAKNCKGQLMDIYRRIVK